MKCLVFVELSVILSTSLSRCDYLACFVGEPWLALLSCPNGELNGTSRCAYMV